jgi:hypothetical protein
MFYVPETTTSLNTRLGVLAEEYIHGSFATSISLFQKFKWLSAIFISAIAWDGSPFSKRWPMMPTDESPVVELELPPMNPVIRTPLPRFFIISSTDLVPGGMMRFVVLPLVGSQSSFLL